MKSFVYATLVSLGFTIVYLIILVAQYGLFTGDGSPLAAMTPGVSVLGVLFYIGFYDYKPIKKIFYIGTLIFLGLVLQILYGGDIYGKYLVYTSKIKLPKALKSYTYLNKAPVQTNGKSIIPLTKRGDYTLRYFDILHEKELITYYLREKDSSFSAYVLKYDLYGNINDSIALKNSNVDNTNDELPHIYEKYNAIFEKKPHHSILSTFKESAYYDFVGNNSSEDYTQKHKTLTHRKIVPVYYLDEKVSTTRDDVFDEIPAHFSIFHGEGKLFVNLNVGTILHLQTDYEISSEYHREINYDSFYDKKGKEEFEAYKNYKLYSNENLHYHLLYVGYQLYMIKD